MNSKQNYSKLLLSFHKCQEELDIALFFKRTEYFRDKEVWQYTKGRVVFKHSWQIMFLDNLHVWKYRLHIRGNVTIKNIFFPNILHFYVYVYFMYMSIKIPIAKCSQKYSFRFNYIKWHFPNHKAGWQCLLMSLMTPVFS